MYIPLFLRRGPSDQVITIVITQNSRHVNDMGIHMYWSDVNPPTKIADVHLNLLGSFLTRRQSKPNEAKRNT